MLQTRKSFKTEVRGRIDLLQVNLSYVLKSERQSRKVDLFCLNRFESYYKFTREKMIDICCVRSDVIYYSLSALIIIFF